MATGTLVSVDEYLSTNYDPDCDFVDGEVIERNVGELPHSGLQGIIFALLYNHGRNAGVYVFPELRVQVKETRFRVPDILVTTHRPKGRVLREPPFLCIEILSPEDRFTRMAARIEDYLAFGVKYVWLIDPETKRAWAYSPEGNWECSGVLTTADPDLTLNLKEVFEALSEHIES